MHIVHLNCLKVSAFRLVLALESLVQFVLWRMLCWLLLAQGECFGLARRCNLSITKALSRTV